MGFPPVRSLKVIVPLCASCCGAALWAASSVNSVASVSILAPSSAITGQDVVTGSVVLPLVSTIGSSVGAIGLPPPSTLSGLGQFRIGTEAFSRQLGRVISQSGLQQASFTIIGDRDQVISIAVPPSVSLSRLGGDGEVEFSPETNIAGNGESRLVASADGSGTLEFGVGGHLEPSSLATAGDYAGVLRVTVQYN